MSVKLEKVINLRDLGGVKVANDREVRGGVFFRSSCLDRASESDTATIKALGINTIVDFRDDNWYEMRRKRDKSEICKNYFNVPVQVESANIVKLKRLSYSALKNLSDQDMIECYENLAFGNHSYKKLFEVIKNGDTPVLFNCSVGKDRTGVASAILLYMLGAPKEEVVNEYILSREAIPKICAKARKRIPFFLRGLIMPKMEPMFLAEPEFILAPLNRIDEAGGIYKYFEAEYGYSKEDIKRVREKYTKITE
ncbi:MAG: tyrosine-protein phosphatase [Firmicutes bacterium]|nr:tyrosine-protein phosphatase [Bacillota bacterium]